MALKSPAVKKSRKIKLRRPIKKISLADTGVSLDERVFLILGQLKQEAEQLEDAETRELWLDAVQTFARTGDIDMLFSACEWRRKVVPLDEFLFSNFYLGMDENEMYPSVLDACEALDGDYFVEAVLKGCIGSGKTTIANIGLARGIYKISCMRHPQTSFGIQSKSSIVFTIQSVRFSTAKKAVFGEFGAYIHHSAYFKNIYPYDHRVLSEMIFREQNVSILPVTSSTTGAISMNVVGGILDEMNFMQRIERSKSANADIETGEFDQAKTLYNTLARRRRSRFTRKGELPGILFLVSSSRYPDDFTEQKAAEARSEGGTDDKIFVYQHALWTAKPRKTFMKEEFRVQVGTEILRSRILGDEEKEIPGTDVINVPMDFHSEFTKDVDGSLRDYAGITILATHPFIQRREAVREAMVLGEKYGYQHPFNVEEVDLHVGLPKPIEGKLRLDVDQFRTAHIDLGLTKDACGLAVGHIAGARIAERVNKVTGIKEIEMMPVIGIDFAMRIVPPINGEIEFALIRKFLTSLRDKHGLDIRYVTFDGWQSVDSRQILRKQGFQTGYLSVEKIEEYRGLRDALYDNRLLLPNNNFLVKELAELETRIQGNKERVDHKPKGSKDVADAVCGVTAFLLQRRAAWSGIRITSENGMHLFGDSELIAQSQGKVMRKDPDANVTRITQRPKITRRNIERKNIRRKTIR